MIKFNDRKVYEEFTHSGVDEPPFKMRKKKLKEIYLTHILIQLNINFQENAN